MRIDDRAGQMVSPGEGDPLTHFGCGNCVRLSHLCVDPDQAVRLREMGLCEGRCVSVLQNRDKMIVRIGGSRIGLHRELAYRMYGTIVDEVNTVGPKSDTLLGRAKHRFMQMLGMKAASPGLRELSTTPSVELGHP